MSAYVRIEQPLPTSTVEALLQQIEARAAAFVPATTLNQTASNRVGQVLYHCNFTTDVQSLVVSLLPMVRAALEVPEFQFQQLELQATSYAAGGEYKTHTDNNFQVYGLANRKISYCYYLGQGFYGGELALGEGAEAIRITPAFNSLIFFPSWVSHAVLPVAMAASPPSLRYTRLTLNGWIQGA